jgi:hypothetical protein
MTDMQAEVKTLQAEIKARYHYPPVCHIAINGDHLIVYVTDRRAIDDVRRLVGDRGEIIYTGRPQPAEMVMG